MNLIQRELLCAGLEKTQFDALGPEALSETQRNVIAYSLFSACLFAAMAVLEWASAGPFTRNIVPYFAIAGVYAAVFAISRRMLPSHPDLVLPMAYLCVAALYVLAFCLTMMRPDMPAVTLIAVMVLTSFLFTDRPVYIILMNIATTAALCAISSRLKPREVAVIDCWNGVTMCVVSIAAALLQRRLRFRALDQARRIRYLSQTDLLTGVRNRNTFEQMSAQYPGRCAQSLTLAYVDVNGLHNLNDTRGHKTGDVMLQTVARALADCFGEEDVYRLGGDEFIAFRPDAPEGEVALDLARAAEALSAQGYDISVGVATAEKDGADVEQLMIEAEQNMYLDKQRYYRQPGHERRRR